jgi:prepilin-type processing-associated H-X9-DG protein
MSITKASLIDLNGQELILDADADTSITADTDDQIDIKIAGSDVITLTSSGITSSAATTITVTDNSDVLHLKSTDDDANVGPVLLLNRVSSSAADGDDIGAIDFDGRNDAGQAVEYASIAASITDASDGTEDGSLNFRTIMGGADTARINLTPTEMTVNEASKDLDFRIESNGQANMLFVDGADDAVVIGHNASRKTLFNTTATAAFQIEGTSGNTAAMSIVRNSNDDNGPQLVLGKSNGTSAGAVTVVTDDALLGRISFQGADGTQTVEGARVEAFVDGTPGADDMPGRLVFSTTADGASSPTEAMRIDNLGSVGLKETSPDAHLHVTSPTVSSGSGDFTTGSNLVQIWENSGSGGFPRVAMRSQSPTVAGVHNFETGKDAYWGETTDTGTYHFRGRDLKVNEGNLVIGTSGKGIDFSATSDATGMSSELLDDYEEGTFTPTTNTSGYTMSSSAGRYTKIGNLVQVSLVVNFSAVGSTNSNVTVNNMPFTALSLSNHHQVGVARETTSVGTIFVTQIAQGTVNMSMNSMDGVNNGSQAILATGKNYSVSISYRV